MATKPKPKKSSSVVVKKADPRLVSHDDKLRSAFELIERYKNLLKQGKAEQAAKMVDQVIKYGKVFQVGEVMYKIGQGMIFSALRSTTDKDTYAHLCSDKYDITVGTADKYATIYEAFFSGDFAYHMPDNPTTGKPFNVFELSMRNLEYGAKLIVQGLWTEETALILFGEGDWQTKRDLVREENPNAIKRERKRRQKLDPATTKEGSSVVNEVVKVFMNRAGEIKAVVGEQYIAFGVFYVEDSNASVRELAKRAYRAIKKEFME